MLLGFKQQFPNGSPTHFVEKILDGTKKHTIRKGHRWRAGMSIQMATGVRTKKYYQFNINRPDLQKCISEQRIIIINTNGNINILVGDDTYLLETSKFDLIKNDGFFNVKQFKEWFFPNGDGVFEGQIIHWTNLKY